MRLLPNLGPHLVGGWGFQERSGSLYIDVTGRNHGTYTGSLGTDWMTRQPYETWMGVGGEGHDAASNYRINLGSINSNNRLSLSGGNTATFLFSVTHESNSINNDFPRLIDKSNGGSGANGYSIAGGTNGSRNCEVYLAGSQAALAVSYFSADPQRCAIVRDGGTYTFYKNGVQTHQVTGASTANYPTTTTNMALLNWNHSTNRDWSGRLGYMYVLDVALPAGAIAALDRQPLNLRSAPGYYPEQVAGPAPTIPPAMLMKNNLGAEQINGGMIN